MANLPGSHRMPPSWRKPMHPRDASYGWHDRSTDRRWSDDRSTPGRLSYLDRDDVLEACVMRRGARRTRGRSCGFLMKVLVVYEFVAGLA